MNEELKLILGENITVAGEQIPITHLRYKGKSKKFVTWTITGEAPTLSANDEDLCSVCSVDVDIFSEGNYLDIKKEIKQKMKNNLHMIKINQVFETEKYFLLRHNRNGGYVYYTVVEKETKEVN